MVNTRELDGVLVQCIYLYILTTNGPCSLFLVCSKDYMLAKRSTYVIHVI